MDQDEIDREFEANCDRVRAQLFGAVDVAHDAVQSFSIWTAVLGDSNPAMADVHEARIKALIAVQCLKDSRKLLGY